MATRNPLAKRLIDGYRSISPATATVFQPIAAKTDFRRQHMTSNGRGFLRRFLHRPAAAKIPEFLSLPVGDQLREKLSAGDRIRLDGLSPPAPGPAPAAETAVVRGGLTVEETRKLLRMYQVEKVKMRLREIPASSVSYGEFVRICGESCGGNDDDKGFEIAKVLDESGNVVVLGNVVLLRPEQVARSMEALISQTVELPSDPRRAELDQLEKTKAIIDQKARANVRAELYGGLGLLLAQTLGFIRLTFWEIGWDIMEPVCFFVTSLHFTLAYGFFLRTSTEPSFQGYFQRRFKAKQSKLMNAYGFDVERYNELRRLFYPYSYCSYGVSVHDHRFSPSSAEFKIA